MMTATAKLSRWEKGDLDRVYVNFPRERGESPEVWGIKIWFQADESGRAVLRSKTPAAARDVASTLEVRESEAWELATDLMGGVIFNYADFAAKVGERA